MSEQRRRKYDPEFKRKVVLLTEEVGRTLGEVADRLGISVDLLYQWRRRYRQQSKIAFSGNGNLCLSPEQKPIRELEKKLKMPKWSETY